MSRLFFYAPLFLLSQISFSVTAETPSFIQNLNNKQDKNLFTNKESSEKTPSFIQNLDNKQDKNLSTNKENSEKIAPVVIDEKQVLTLISQTCNSLAKDAKLTIEKIIKGDEPFQDRINPEIYVFVFDKNVKMVAHPFSQLVGVPYKGIPDIKGYKWRDNVVTQALLKGHGSEEYYFKKLNDDTIYKKKIFYQSVTGNNGEQYIVCSGFYLKSQ